MRTSATALLVVALLVCGNVLSVNLRKTHHKAATLQADQDRTQQPANLNDDLQEKSSSDHDGEERGHRHSLQSGNDSGNDGESDDTNTMFIQHEETEFAQVSAKYDDEAENYDHEVEQQGTSFIQKRGMNSAASTEGDDGEDKGESFAEEAMQSPNDSSRPDGESSDDDSGANMQSGHDSRRRPDGESSDEDGANMQSGHDSRRRPDGESSDEDGASGHDSRHHTSNKEYSGANMQSGHDSRRPDGETSDDDSGPASVNQAMTLPTINMPSVPSVPSINDPTGITGGSSGSGSGSHHKKHHQKNHHKEDLLPSLPDILGGGSSSGSGSHHQKKH